MGHPVHEAIETLEACSQLVTFIRQSHVKAQLSKTVIPDVDTRWHSKVNMIESVLNAWDEIEQVLIDRDHDLKKKGLAHLEAIDRTTLEKLLVILKPFREAILQVETSSKYPTKYPLAILTYQGLIDSLHSDEDETWIRVLKKKLLENVQKKLLIGREHRIGTLLHPSYRGLDLYCIKKQLDKRKAHNAIRDLFRDESTLFGQDDDNVLDGVESGLTSNAKRPRVAADGFLSKFCRFNQIHANDELKHYLAEPAKEVLCTEVLDWWKVGSNSYPKLSAIARKYLTVPATSAASESAFRYAGLTVNELRNGLSSETVSDLFFVRHYENN